MVHTSQVKIAAWLTEGPLYLPRIYLSIDKSYTRVGHITINMFKIFGKTIVNSILVPISSAVGSSAENCPCIQKFASHFSHQKRLGNLLIPSLHINNVNKLKKMYSLFLKYFKRHIVFIMFWDILTFVSSFWGHICMEYELMRYTRESAMWVQVEHNFVIWITFIGYKDL